MDMQMDLNNRIDLYTNDLQECAKSFPGVRVYHQPVGGDLPYRWKVTMTGLSTYLGIIKADDDDLVKLNLPCEQRREYLCSLLQELMKKNGIKPIDE